MLLSFMVIVIRIFPINVSQDYGKTIINKDVFIDDIFRKVF